MTPVSWPDGVCGDDVRGVGEAGFFDDGEGVHVGADEERGAGAVLEDADDAEGVGAVGVEADVVGDGVAGFAECGGERWRRCALRGERVRGGRGCLCRW